MHKISEQLKNKLTAFCQAAESQIEDLVNAYKQGSLYFDPLNPEKYPYRSCGDAIELLAMFGKEPENKDALISHLQSFQTQELDYHVLSVGYALELLGSYVNAPYEKAQLTGRTLEAYLESLPFSTYAWAAGDYVDALGTAMYQNQKHFGILPDNDTLYRWLNNHVNPDGTWGSTAKVLDRVNGFYRLTRGTYAQFDKPLPCPKEIIDTVLLHANTFYQEPKLENACNVLDTVHPLWLAAKQTNYRQAEVIEWIVPWIDKILDNYTPKKGFAFTLSEHENLSLMGTEMWLTILYLMCDYLGISHLLNFSPKGVHRIHTDLT